MTTTETSRRHGQAGRLARTWGQAGGPVAVVVIVVQLLWRGSVLRRGWFTQDDFLVMRTCHESGFSDLLSSSFPGGVSPGGFALACWNVGAGPLNWSLAAGSILVLQTGAAILMWVVLTRILGTRWLRVPIMVLFCVSPLTLWTTQWWSFALQFWPATILLLVALWALIIAIQDRVAGAQVVAVLAVASAFAFHEPAVLFPLVLMGVALAVQTGDTVAQRAARTVKDLRWTWLALLVITAGYATLRWPMMSEGREGGDSTIRVITIYLRHAFSELVGGPWAGDLPAHAYLVPKSWVVALAVALLLALVGYSLQSGGSSARVSWALFATYLAGSVGLLAVLGDGDLTASLGLVHRFAAGLAAVTAVCLAGCQREVELQPLRLPRRAWVVSARRTEVLLSAGLAGLYLLASAASTAWLAPNLYHADDRRYVAKLRAELRADPQIVLLDGAVPAGVISPWFGARARVSSVVAVAPENPVFDLPSQKLRIVADSGELAQVALEGSVGMTPPADLACGYAVRQNGTWVPMQQVVPRGRWVLRLGYYTNVDGFAILELPTTTMRIPVRNGLHNLDLVVDEGFTGFRLTFEDDRTTLCLTDARAGVPRPQVE